MKISTGREMPDDEIVTEQEAANLYVMVAGAFAVGFVLGGGLFTRLTARIANVALRVAAVAALPQLKSAVVEAAERALTGAQAPKSNRSAK